jgi:predicted lipoprotein with Yx(FWY)xxD motif
MGSRTVERRPDEGDARMFVESRRRRLVVAVAVATLALLGLAACGSDDDDASSAGESTTAPAVQTTVAAAATTTPEPAVLKTSTKDPFGTFLTDPTGKTLYVFDRDTTPTSACTGRCATTWPPLLAPDGAGTPLPLPAGATGELTVAPRPDGAGAQVVWNGKPLYRYSGDAKPGDTTGDGIGGTWHVAKLS